MRIAVDFDNTLVSYGTMFGKTAASLGFIAPDRAPEKDAIRDLVRALDDGEAKWQRLQAIVYGAGIGEARPFDGVRPFLAAARRAGAKLFLVSHKSEFAAADPHGVNLRTAARGWMNAQNLIGDGGFAPQDVYFESTRAEKIARVTSLNATHAIDDLIEVFAEPAFPSGVERLLFAPDGAPADTRWTVYRQWADVTAALFPNG